MKIIAFLNIKGGVAKTTSAIAVAQLLATEHGKRVLVLDTDAQANTTRTLTKELPTLTTADLMTSRSLVAKDAVIRTEYGVDLIGSSFALMNANKAVMLDGTRPQQLRLRRQLAELEGDYDYCIVDCPPDISMTVINVLAACDDVLVPIRADKYGFDGLSYVVDAINEVQEYNPKLRLAGCFLTMYQKGTNLSAYTRELLALMGEKAMKSAIRSSVKVGEATFDKPLISYAPKSAVAQDYRELLIEYLKEKEDK